MSKKYRHIQGFGDSTDYILVEGADIHGIRKDGSKFRPPNDYTQEEIDEYVREGHWEEVK